jgi:hypothetical protein
MTSCLNLDAQCRLQISAESSSPADNDGTDMSSHIAIPEKKNYSVSNCFQSLNKPMHFKGISVGGTYCHLNKSDERWWVVNHHKIKERVSIIQVNKAPCYAAVELHDRVGESPRKIKSRDNAYV